MLLVGQVLDLVAMRGFALLEDRNTAQLAQELDTVVKLGLHLAASRVGRGLDLQTVPLAISALTARWAQGDIPTLDADDPDIQDLFGGVVEDVARAIADV